jgi:hypothetical protein
MDISLIAQREIEARLAAAMVAEYAQTLGRARARAIAGAAVEKMAREAGAALYRRTGTNTLSDLAGVARDIWARDGALTIEFIEVGPRDLRFDVTRCRYAEMYAAMDAGDLGYYFSCGRDAAFARGYNPRICMTRTQTIMQGAAYCDFHFRLTPED